MLDSLHFFFVLVATIGRSTRSIAWYTQLDGVFSPYFTFLRWLGTEMYFFVCLQSTAWQYNSKYKNLLSICDVIQFCVNVVIILRISSHSSRSKIRSIKNINNYVMIYGFFRLSQINQFKACTQFKWLRIGLSEHFKFIRLPRPSFSITDLLI